MRPLPDDDPTGRGEEFCCDFATGCDPFGPLARLLKWQSARETAMKPYRGLFDVTDDWADTTDARPFDRWAYGAVLAAVLATYAVSVLVTQRASLPARHWTQGFIEYEGLPATALGGVYLAIALFAHLHYFWTASPRFWGYAQLGKMLAAAAIIGGIAVFFFAVLAA
jgi:hypothetical protein